MPSFYNFLNAWKALKKYILQYEAIDIGVIILLIGRIWSGKIVLYDVEKILDWNGIILNKCHKKQWQLKIKYKDGNIYFKYIEWACLQINIFLLKIMEIIIIEIDSI